MFLEKLGPVLQNVGLMVFVCNNSFKYGINQT